MKEQANRIEWSHETEEEFVIDRGIIVLIEGMAWGPFQLPEEALGWALKHRPNNLFKLMPLLNPAIID